MKDLPLSGRVKWFKFINDQWQKNVRWGDILQTDYLRYVGLMRICAYTSWKVQKQISGENNPWMNKYTRYSGLSLGMGNINMNQCKIETWYERPSPENHAVGHISELHKRVTKKYWIETGGPWMTDLQMKTFRRSMYWNTYGCTYDRWETGAILQLWCILVASWRRYIWNIYGKIPWEGNKIMGKCFWFWSEKSICSQVLVSLANGTLLKVFPCRMLWFN